MPGLDDYPSEWAYRVKDPDRFDRIRSKAVTSGVRILLGRVKGTDRWEIQAYRFSRERFKTREQVRQWLEQNVKAELQILLDFRAWNESRRRLLDMWLSSSSLTA
jgi:hypothetical protein